jgi:Na+/H+ antiporter NhaD/arsenite permease-like protein
MTAHAQLAAMARGLPLFTVLPFASLLLAIALLPLFAGRWWEVNRNKGYVAALLALPVALYLPIIWGEAGQAALVEKILEYVSFITLLGSLFVVSGGIYLQGSLAGTPPANTAILAIGAVLANLIGTTGASVVLIRPLLRANRRRHRKAHIVVFFIFVVANCGGLLTPLGDPPLFLGFLKGVPFGWTLHLWPQWFVVNLALLVTFNLLDQVVLDREEKARPTPLLEAVLKHERFKIHGWHNLLFMGGIIATVLASGRGLFTAGGPWPFGPQEVLMAAIAAGSYVLTPEENRRKNEFTFGPIVEVAVLFAGIFVTMAPALLILNSWGQGEREVLGAQFGLRFPWQFFWAAGGLSGFLDNAPTYLTFAATLAGLERIDASGLFLRELLGRGPEAARLLAAISTGAVFMGANTYIGNGPNFMVKAIAEEHGVRMPSFFGYMAYSAGILLPIFVVVTIVFFR